MAQLAQTTGCGLAEAFCLPWTASLHQGHSMPHQQMIHDNDVI